jgi:hypothetical protein
LSPLIFPAPFTQPGQFFFGFCRAQRMLTGEPFNPIFFGTAGIASDPNRAAHRRSKRLWRWRGIMPNGGLPFRIAPTATTRRHGLRSMVHAEVLIRTRRGDRAVTLRVGIRDCREKPERKNLPQELPTICAGALPGDSRSLRRQWVERILSNIASAKKADPTPVKCRVSLATSESPIRSMQPSLLQKTSRAEKYSTFSSAAIFRSTASPEARSK